MRDIQTAIPYRSSTEFSTYIRVKNIFHIYNDIHALQRMSVQNKKVQGRESPSLFPLVISDGNPVHPVLLGSFSCVRVKCCVDYIIVTFFSVHLHESI